MMPRQTVDISAASILAVCSCGWRDLASSRLNAREAITQHVRSCHPYQLDTAARAEQRMRQRHA